MLSTTLYSCLWECPFVVSDRANRDVFVVAMMLVSNDVCACVCEKNQRVEYERERKRDLRRHSLSRPMFL